jgi:hypothetical protein
VNSERGKPRLMNPAVFTSTDPVIGEAGRSFSVFFMTFEALPPPLFQAVRLGAKTSFRPARTSLRIKGHQSRS